MGSESDRLWVISWLLHGECDFLGTTPMRVALFWDSHFPAAVTVRRVRHLSLIGLEPPPKPRPAATPLLPNQGVVTLVPLRGAGGKNGFAGTLGALVVKRLDSGEEIHIVPPGESGVPGPIRKNR
jgi:hypothetical protein